MGEHQITDKYVLAYSGGLDTSVLIKYLQERCKAQVITVTVDVGQGDDLVAAEEKAKETWRCKTCFNRRQRRIRQRIHFPSHQSQRPLRRQIPNQHQPISAINRQKDG